MNQADTVADIATQLGEKDETALDQIKHVVQGLGQDVAQALLTQTLDIEAGKGMLTKNKKRRRTPGGVFFALARDYVIGQGHSWYVLRSTGQLKPYQPEPHSPRSTKPKTRPPKLSRLQWADRLEIAADLEQEKGSISTVKITLIGRPGKIIEKDNVIVTIMHNDKLPSLSKQLPPVPEKPTNYIVLVTKKQWRKVAEAIKDPDDSLIIEGYPVLDAQMRSITVFAQSATTKLLQRAKQE